MRSAVPADGGSRRHLLVIGAGGHAAVVIDVARAAGWAPLLALDPGAQTEVLGVPVRGGDELVGEVLAEGLIDAGTVAIGNNELRRKIGRNLRFLGCVTPPIFHPTAVISPSARIGSGTVVMAGAVVNARARIGEDCIINTGAIIEHDCILEDGVHAAPRSVMGGNCSLGACTLFGVGSSMRPGTMIGANVVVGAGSVVVASIPDGVTVAGNPAVPLSRARAVSTQ